MTETSSSSPITPKHTNPAVAARSPEEKHTPPLRVKSFCCSSAPLSSSPSSLNSSSTCSSSSYISHLSFPFTPPSPFCSSSVIPFSWEKQPGVPKNRRPENRQQNPDPTLPLPPPLRCNSDSFLSVPRKKRSELGFARDPFAVALIECSKEDRRGAAEDEDGPGMLWRGRAAAAAASKVMRGRRRTIGDRFGLVDLYGSCKTTCSVADSAVYIPRSGR